MIMLVLARYTRCSAITQNELGDPYFSLSNYDKHDKMQLFGKFKKFCGVGSEPP